MKVLRFLVWMLVVVAWRGLQAVDEMPAVSQTISIREGWNAIYINVIPQESVDELFADWPVDSVSFFRALSANERGKVHAGEVLPLPRYFIWHRDTPEASTLTSLPGDSVLVFKASKSLPDQVIIGTPIGRQVKWELGADATNYFGIQVEDGKRVSIADYLSGLSEDGHITIFSISGTGATPTLTQRSWTSNLKTGDVLVLQGVESNDWKGVFSVEPREGINFGETKTTGVYAITNDSAMEQTVTLSFNGATGENTPSFKLMQRTVTAKPQAWQAFTEPITKTLAPDEVWTIGLGVDRRQFEANPSGELRCGILTANADAPTYHQVQIPVYVNAHTIQSAFTEQQWPNGLWLLEASMTAVTRIVSSDGSVEDSVPTASVMPVRLLMYVDANKKMTLLQRVTLAVLGESGLKQSQILYGPEAKTPGTETDAIRLSTPLMPVDVPSVAVSGTFLESGTAHFTVGATSPSNPWRHAYHPEHDGLDWDFNAELPSGDDFNHYLGRVKPELWSVDNQLKIEWDSSEEEWRPFEFYTGTLTWTITGLRHEAPIVVEGDFTFRRIIANPTYQED